MAVRYIDPTLARPGDDVFVNGLLLLPGNDYFFGPTGLEIMGLRSTDTVIVIRRGPTALEEMGDAIEDGRDL